MGKDWQAVADAITNRLTELGMTQRELSERSGLSVTTLRQIQNNYSPRKRSPRTLADISEALHWPPGHLAQVLDEAPELTEEKSVFTLIEELRAEVAELRSRVETVESRQSQNGAGGGKGAS